MGFNLRNFLIAVFVGLTLSVLGIFIDCFDAGSVVLIAYFGTRCIYLLEKNNKLLREMKENFQSSKKEEDMDIDI